MLRNYIKIAWRNILKNKGTSIINIAGLSTGIAVVMIIGMWIIDEVQYNSHFSQGDRIAQMYIQSEGNNGIIFTGEAMSIPTVNHLKDNFQGDFEGVSIASWNAQHLLSNGDKKFVENGMQVDPVFPKMLDVELLFGDRETCLDAPYSIILNRSLAEALFGPGDPLGKILRFDTAHDIEVTGVFEDFPNNTSFRNTHYFMPWKFYEITNPWVKNSNNNWENHSFQGFVMIQEGLDMKTVADKIKDVEKDRYEWGQPDIILHPMSDWYLRGNFKDGEKVGGRIQFVWMFGIIGLFVLILACINFMNLSTARSEKRAKEVGIRKTIGSGRGQLIGQFLSESSLIAFLSLVLGLVILQLSIEPFNDLAAKEIEVPWSNPVFWSFLIGFTLFVGFMAGSYPAFYMSAFRPIRALRGVHIKKGISSLPRKVLVTIQFTVSISLIIGTLVVFQQIQHAKNRPMGFDMSNSIYFYDTPESKDKFELMRHDLLSTGQIETISHSSGPITNVWSNINSFDWEGKDPEETITFGTIFISHEFGKSVGWEIAKGRDLDRNRSMDSTALILNESAANIMGLKNPVGQFVEFNDQSYEVVGVVRDLLMESPWRPVKPTIFLYSADWKNVYNVRFKAEVSTESALGTVQHVFQKYSPSTPFDYYFVDEEYQSKFQSEERIGNLARVFAFLAIFISCLGLLGLSAFVAEQKTKEIGIRKILGASVTNLWAMQSKGFIVLVGIACLISIPIAWYFLDAWLADYDYRITIGWQVFMIATVLSILVTMLTVSFQSIKAAVTNPINSLRNE